MSEKVYNFIGEVVRCTYSTDDFKIYAVNIDKNSYPEIQLNSYGNVSILGELPNLIFGQKYEIEAITKDSKYGISYNVLNIRICDLETKEDMYYFLSEILTTHQADVLYNVYPDIVQRVRENRLDDIDLNKLYGIKEKTFEKIKDKIIENFCLADLVNEFKGHLSFNIIKKIYKKYTSIEVVKKKLREKPYKCLCDLSGVGFKTADKILLEIEKVSKENIKNGKDPIIDFEYDLLTSEQRCLSCLMYILYENETEGHTKMNLADLRNECMKIVPECSHHFSSAMKYDCIYYNKENMDASLKSTYNTEKYIAETIYNGLLYENKWNWNFDIEKYRSVKNVLLSDEQMCALDNVCKYNISILNGAAGCGKTFLTHAVINMLKSNNKSFKLFSPTGKAAKILSENTGEHASTIHRGLGYVPPTWLFNKDNKLHVDIIIVDEFSMVDIKLFERLLDAVDLENTKLLLIGDNAQLPSVSCGNLLHDFMQTKLIPTTTLTKVFRYDEGGLMKVATDVRFCKPYLKRSAKNKKTSFGVEKDYIYFDFASEVIPSNVVLLYKTLLDKGCNIKDIQVLTAKNIGDCGTIDLNNKIQKIANPNYGSQECMKIGNTVYYVGDLVIQTANNYKAELDQSNNEIEFEAIKKNEVPTAFVANGETGVIQAIFDTYLIIDFDGIFVKYRKSDMTDVALGYSISIHKSQGSSIDNVILCTPQTHAFMLNSNLLYVGLTRMRKKCYHLGSFNTINKSIYKKENLERKTFMKQLLIELNTDGKNLDGNNELPWYTDEEYEKYSKFS